MGIFQLFLSTRHPPPSSHIHVAFASLTKQSNAFVGEKHKKTIETHSRSNDQSVYILSLYWCVMIQGVLINQ